MRTCARLSGPRQLAGKSSAFSLAQVLVHERDRHAAFADRCRDTFYGSGPNVAAREHARHTRLEQVRIAIELPGSVPLHRGPSEDEAVGVDRDLRRKPRRLRVGSHEDEEAAGIETPGLAGLRSA